jgi:hypothetical protein
MAREEESGEVQPPSRFIPPPEWLAAFHREYSGTLALLVAGYATERAAGVGRAQRRDKRYPRALVVRVLTDTLLGIVRWDHTTSLRDHVVRVIRKRSRIHWKRTSRRAEQRYRHLHIEATNASGRSHAQEELDRITWQLQTEREHALAGLAELGARAVGDPELLAYLHARFCGDSPAEAARQVGLSPERHERMRRRLGQLIKQLSIEARPSGRSEDTTP